MWNYTTGIKIFQSKCEADDLLSLPLVNALSPDQQISGVACRAARDLLMLSQAFVSERSKVAKKSLNDFENEYLVLKPQLVHRLRTVLEQEGARFFVGERCFGVQVVLPRDVAEQRARASKARQPMALLWAEPEPGACDPIEPSARSQPRGAPRTTSRNTAES